MGNQDDRHFFPRSPFNLGGKKLVFLCEEGRSRDLSLCFFVFFFYPRRFSLFTQFRGKWVTFTVHNACRFSLENGSFSTEYPKSLEFFPIFPIGHDLPSYLSAKSMRGMSRIVPGSIEEWQRETLFLRRTFLCSFYGWKMTSSAAKTSWPFGTIVVSLLLLCNSNVNKDTRKTSSTTIYLQ